MDKLEKYRSKVYNGNFSNLFKRLIIFQMIINYISIQIKDFIIDIVMETDLNIWSEIKP